MYERVATEYHTLQKGTYKNDSFSTCYRDCNSIYLSAFKSRQRKKEGARGREGEGEGVTFY